MNTSTNNVLISLSNVNDKICKSNLSETTSQIESKEIVLPNYNKQLTHVASQNSSLDNTSAIFDVIYKSSSLKLNTDKGLFDNSEQSSCLSNPYKLSKNISKHYNLNTSLYDYLRQPNENLSQMNQGLSINKTLSSCQPPFTNSNPLTKNCLHLPSNKSESISSSNRSNQASANVPHLQPINGDPNESIVSTHNYILNHLQTESTLYVNKSNRTNDNNSTIYSNTANIQSSVDVLTTQKAVAFLAGPRERIYVLGNPIDYCLRCNQEGLGQTSWRPHRHIGELKIRYICERHFDDWESNHHIDIPLCPICSQVLYLYELNVMLGVSNARRLHKYILKCASRHILPLLDLFCQTKKGGERCNANFKLQWCYGTMVKRCELQKNRDHDLWWVRYKNEWKQRRTVIRYKKDFLSHLTDAQRSSLLGLGLEGEAPPDPKLALGPTFDTLVATVGCSTNGQKTRKRNNEKPISLSQIESCIGNIYSNSQKQPIQLINDNYEYPAFSYTCPKPTCQNSLKKPESSSNLSRNFLDSYSDISFDLNNPNSIQYLEKYLLYSSENNTKTKSQSNNKQIMVYERHNSSMDLPDFDLNVSLDIEGLNINSIITGTPTPPLASNNCFSVITSVVGNPLLT